MSPEIVTYSSEGSSFAGELYLPDHSEEAVPGIVLFHEGAGITAHIRERAQLLTAEGYIVFVPDLFGQTISDRASGIALITALTATAEPLRSRASAALSFLQNHSRTAPNQIVALGFCFGGFAALELARSGALVRGSISIHGGLTTTAPARVGDVKAKILICTGAADPFVDNSQFERCRDEMENAQVDWQACVYGGAKHGFTNRWAAVTATPGNEYDARNDRRAWRQTLLFLKDALSERD